METENGGEAEQLEESSVKAGSEEQKRNTEAGHLIWPDYLRALATVSVICVHTFSLAAAELLPGSTLFRILDLLTFTFLSCNPLFIMISGALLLPVRGERAGTFFAKRFTKAALPMIVYYVLYVCAKEGLIWLSPKNWFVMLQRILSGAPYEAPHFWLVYVILELYLLTPFLRWILHRIPDSVFSWVILVVFAVCTFYMYFPSYRTDSLLDRVVDTSAGIFLLGYFLSQKCSVHLERFFIACGVLSYVFSCYLILYSNDYRAYFDRNAPTMMLFSAAIFLTVKRAAENRSGTGRLTGLISGYSFSILLIHWGILHFAVKQVLKVDVLDGGVAGGCLLAIVLTLFLSLIGAAAVDHLLIFPLQAIVKRAVAFLTKRKKGHDQ